MNCSYKREKVKIFIPLVHNGDRMAKYKIVQDRESCIADGVCAALCPDNWYIADDGLASPVKTELDDLGCNMDAAQACPVNIIHIYEIKEDGSQKQLI
jgi:ferredoxin